MKATIELEAIGDDTTQTLRGFGRMLDGLAPGLGGMTVGRVPSSQWVAEIKGPDRQYKWSREFLHGYKDYSRANSVGSRGIYVIYTLESGKIYEVKKPVSWKNTLRYFCRVDDDGSVIVINEDEVLCLINGC